MIVPKVAYEAVSTEGILYERGNVCKKLEGFYAWLYRAMIKRYGEAEATERYWWLWHKKEGSLNSNHHEAVKAHLQ